MTEVFFFSLYVLVRGPSAGPEVVQTVCRTTNYTVENHHHHNNESKERNRKLRLPFGFPPTYQSWTWTQPSASRTGPGYNRPFTPRTWDTTPYNSLKRSEWHDCGTTNRKNKRVSSFFFFGDANRRDSFQATDPFPTIQNEQGPVQSRTPKEDGNSPKLQPSWTVESGAPRTVQKRESFARTIYSYSIVLLFTV